MNKKYMDFVPKSSKGAVKKVTKEPTAGLKQNDFVETKEVEVNELEVNEIFEAREEKPRAGVTRSHAGMAAPRTVAKAHAGMAAPRTVTKAHAGMAAPRTVTKAPKMAKAPEAPKVEDYRKKFVNTEKVAKRPLSKNVYKKKVVVPKEAPSGPVTIIDKPEKDSRVGLVVTIIITIILGAAAGTVAFLLLPK